MIEIYTEQLNKQPKQAWSYVTRSDAYKEADDHANAAADLSKAIELAPGDGQLYARRGEFYRSLGKHDHAMADLFRAIELKPSWGLSIYGYTYDGYHTRAITLLSRQLEFNPTDSSALAQRGDAYLALGKIDHAIADIFKVVELDPNSALAYSRRAELHEARGELAKAIADLSRAIAIEPTVPWRHVRRAKLFEASGEPGRASTDYASAIDMLSKKLDTGAPNTDDLLSRAEVLEAKGDDARALEDVFPR